VRILVKRFWSLALALGLPVVELFAEKSSIYPDYEIMRAVLSVVGIALLCHSWVMQRTNVKNSWRLAFWTLLLMLFVLGFLWLGLNSIRGSTYPNDPNADNWAYWFAVEWQERIVVLQRIVATIIGILAVIDLVRWFNNRKANRQASFAGQQKPTSEGPRS
jgi:uncharacterized membrane protein